MNKIATLFVLTIINLSILYGQTYTVSTVAGSSSPGFVNGQGTAASFDDPSGVAIDATGNLYVTDSWNNVIRKITPNGLVTTFAGSGTVGSTDGQGVAASFSWPYGIVIDKNDNIYVADHSNHIIRKITLDGMVSTFAGSKGPGGFLDGQGSAARFYHPAGIAVDTNGNVYVADCGNNRIRKITPNGLVSTFAGSGAVGSTNGVGSSATFCVPYGITVDRSGNVYVTEPSCQFHGVRKITPSGVVSNFAGSTTSGQGDGQGAAAGFLYAMGMAVDGNGNIYVVGSGNSIIQKITPTGYVTTIAGSQIGDFGNVDAVGTAARFKHPLSVTVDLSGNIYVADTGNDNIRKITINPSTGIKENSDSAFINIFPNPAQNQITITLSTEIQGTIALIDLQGKTVLSQSINGNTIHLATSSVSKGIYIVKVESKTNIYTGQIVIEK